MKEILLIKNGEIALKGLNRSSFEDTLIKNIKTALPKRTRANVWRYVICNPTSMYSLMK